MATIYRGFDICKDAGGYFFKNDSGFQSGYFKSEDAAMDAVDAMRRAGKEKAPAA